MPILDRIFGEARREPDLAPLYQAVVARGRDPFWYREGRVPDTIDGRFDMIAAMLALVLLRLEREGEAGRGPSALLTERFVADMDATLRQIGIGDYVVGKHVGRMISALGGRLGAFRDGGFTEAVRRNIFHEAPPAEAAVTLVAERLERFAAALEATSLDALLEGRLP